MVGKQAKRVAESEAMGYVGGYCLALDMTARFLDILNTKCNNLKSYHFKSKQSMKLSDTIRDFQDEAKKKGHPWTLAKVMDCFDFPILYRTEHIAWLIFETSSDV